MNDLQIHPITPENVELVVRLLYERSGTIPAYVRWKYVQRQDSDFRGVVATHGGEPVGCFGLMVRELRLKDRTVPCGWFEDWYVAESSRTGGVGTEMLRYISRACPVVFGHPGPEKASAICIANGYRPLPFQSRRRLICRRYLYERSRTRYFLKAAANAFTGWRQSVQERRVGRALSQTVEFARNSIAVRFVNTKEHRDWVLSQPVMPGISRKTGVWKEDGLEVLFFDDELPSTGLRRRVLFAEGPEQFSATLWKRFARDTRAAGCIHIELFTTDARLDAVWAMLGALSQPESPVLICSEFDLGKQVILHGWDRQDWTFLADQSRVGRRVASNEAVPPKKLPDSRPMSQRVSVVIPTYRRRKNLLRVLDDLARQSHQPLEVFVVDASPIQDQLTDEELSRYPNWLHYLSGHPQGNVSRQRNEALRRCVGDTVLFLDDDVEFESDLIVSYLDAFHETGADGISGVVLLPNEKLSKHPKHQHTVPIEYPGSPNYQAVDAVLETHVICTASFAASRASLLEVGGFDEQLGGVLDDVDLGIRMKAKGFRILHHNRPKLLHLKVPATGSRSSDLGFQWAMTNLFYFQLRHYWGARRSLLLTRTLWDCCRPSRHWLTPRFVKRRWFSVTQSYREAKKRVSVGPQLLVLAERQQ